MYKFKIVHYTILYFDLFYFKIKYKENVTKESIFNCLHHCVAETASKGMKIVPSAGKANGSVMEWFPSTTLISCNSLYY